METDLFEAKDPHTCQSIQVYQFRDVIPTHDYEERQEDVSDWGHHLDWFASTAGVSKWEASGSSWVVMIVGCWVG